MKLVVGSLVESQKHFKGIGKILKICVEKKTAKIGFFTSPRTPYDSIIELKGSELKGKERLFEKTVVFCKFGSSQNWRMGFYDGERPNNQHLVYFNHSESDVFDIEDLFVPNTLNNSFFSPLYFLSERATGSVKHYTNRTRFVNSYIEQRKSCRSISSLPSSAVNLEAHQLSVVMQVLSDPKQKYLLGDEVGLGKTIEAGFLIREHVLEMKNDAAIIVFTPDALVNQWKTELSKKFHLEDLIEDDYDVDELNIIITPYNNATSIPENFKTPTMVVIDEGHNLSKYAWSNDSDTYNTISNLCKESTITLILSGTPISGNAKSFLAMLHCLSPENYHLTQKGIKDFNFKVESRQQLAGIYEALSEENDDFTLESVVADIEALELEDDKLFDLLSKLKPEIDFFNDEKNETLRNTLITDIKSHFGERYRLFQRFIRNRRGAKNSNIEQLFPGLGNVEVVDWEVSDDLLSLDEQLDDLRNIFVEENDQSLKTCIPDLLNALLDAPFLLKKKLHLLKKQNKYQKFTDVIDFTMDSIDDEQTSKDNSAKLYIEKWLLENPDGKVTVFCGEPSVADNFFHYLEQSRDDVERHNPLELPQFITNEKIRILVLDEKGEDGLNLQGSKRLAIHYSLPRSIVRIEQRIGRLNRYCATDIGIKPIENMLLVPSSAGFISNWARLLVDTIGVFSETTASIQLVLEDLLEQEETLLVDEGFNRLESIKEMISGENGLIAKEKKKVADQEVWQEMKYGFAEIKEFSHNLQTCDVDSEEKYQHIQRWIKESLKFNVRKTEDKCFVYQYILGRTRLNVDDFLKHCILGIDFDSGQKNPSTKPMTPDREVTSRTGAYPLRFGQPFLDTIFNFTLATPIGLSTSVIRKINTKIPEPKTFIKLNWLCTLESESIIEQRNLDVDFPPEVKTEWINHRGDIENNEAILGLLEKPVKLKQQSPNDYYQDFEISISGEQNVWELVNQFVGPDEWKETVEAYILNRETELIEELITNNVSLNQHSKLSVVLVSVMSLTLIGG